MLADTLEGAMAGLDATQRHILELTLQGFPPAEVAGRVGCSERTVSRVLARFRARLERLQAHA